VSPNRPSASLKRLFAAASLLVLVFGDPRSATPVAAGSPPDAPVIASPLATDVGADDVHMEMGAPFRDPDGDAHVATDWEIRSGDGATVVWAAYRSPVLVHAHLGDGVFQGPLAGQRRLNYGWPYLFRVRYLDSSGDWSEWAERPFVTARKVQIPAQQAIGILAQPAPGWSSDGGAPIALPAGSRLAIEDGQGTALLTLTGGDGLTVVPGPFLAEPNVLRLHLVAPPGAAVDLPSSRLTFILVEPGGARRQTVYLPALMVAAGADRVLWVTETGATFYGVAEETHATRERLARDTTIPWEVEPGYRLEAVVASLQLPTSLAFVDDPGADPAAPRFYLTEIYCRKQVVTKE
jgi:hypothetical protein